MKKLLSLFLSIVSLLGIFTCDDSTRPNLPPIIVVSANLVSGVAPLTVSFSSSAEDADGAIAAYSWNFGDGAGSSTQQNPSYTYTTAGAFTATCTVSDSGKPALTASATVVITVFQSKIPTLSAISPDWSVIHMPGFTLTATGTDFIPQSLIVFDGTEMVTTYINPTQLSCRIRPDDTVLSSALKSDGTLNLEADQYTGVLVRNPGTYGGDSASLNFTIRPNHLFASPQLFMSTSYEVCTDYLRLLKGDPLYAVYREWLYGYPDWVFYIKASTDYGQSWSGGNLIINGVIGLSWDLEAGSDGVLYMASLGANDLYFSKSTDDGANWTVPVMVAEGSPDDTMYDYYRGESENIIRLDDGTFYAVWEEEAVDVEGYVVDCWILHSSSKDNGKTWTKAARIPVPEHTVSSGPFLAKSLSGKIHCFYALYDFSGMGQWSYLHMTSTDGGASWSTPVDISSFKFMPYAPYVGDDDGLFIPTNAVGAASQQIAVKYWLDGEGSWSTTSPAVSLGLSETIVNISVCVDSAGNINLLYTYGLKEGSYAVYFQRSIDRGRTWTAPQRLSSLGNRKGASSHLCDAAGNLYVIWVSVNNPYPVYFTSSERNQ